MYLLYADESGSPGDPQQNHFILAGFSIFERKAHWLSEEMDKIAIRFDPQNLSSVELHGSPMMTGKGIWRKIPHADRIAAIEDALKLIDGVHYRVFASVVNKTAISPDDPVRHTFEQIISRFDHFLARQYKYFSQAQRGLVIFDKHEKKEAPIQALAREFKTSGHTWGNLRNMAEVPVFVDSQATRLIQLADLIAYAIFRKYERNDTRFYQFIDRKFDYFGGVRHGLHESI
ncbi:DUF3800 domain-containing protein [Magnetofaba australis]|uniref:DUF3800 domain-containing protein n=1 Tax=Magnetofaba australis IT-1 TaxID=1434232 RepID=A0A1Y2K847_9PROT|nr:DUF3800 domain-containing protein [Magnetofaba australis]OSM06903.1 hypothetical protein MAIT1_00217 [Magnetofaba australis IT-1]